MDRYGEGYEDGYEEGLEAGLAEARSGGGVMAWGAFGVASGVFLIASGLGFGSLLLAAVLFLVVSFVAVLARPDRLFDRLYGGDDQAGK